MAQKQKNDIPTPVNIIWENILMLPIFGTVDSARAQEIMKTTLNKIVETGSKIIIVDILGTTTMDSAVANHFVKIARASKLVGCETIISGMSAEIAQTLAGLGVELGEVVTTSTLADALELSFGKLGIEVRKVKK